MASHRIVLALCGSFLMSLTMCGTQPTDLPSKHALLTNDLKNYFKIAHDHFPITVPHNSVKALVVPHAGYDYSGLCAACAYQSLLTSTGKKNETIKQVIILAISHFDAFKGIALPIYKEYKTILGTVPVDHKTIKRIKRKHKIIERDSQQSKEPAIEMQLPFLQHTIKDFKIIPFIVGKVTKPEAYAFAQSLKTLIDPSTLVIVSTDFTHFGKNYSYSPFTRNILLSIQALDNQAINSLIQGSYDQFDALLQISRATICGLNALRVFLALLDLKALGQTNPFLSCYYTSAQMTAARKGEEIVINSLFKTPGDFSFTNSVSYASLVFSSEKPPTSLSEYDKHALLKTARDVLENHLKDKKNALEDHFFYPPLSLALQKNAGALVTLKNKKGIIKGKSGIMTSDKPLYKIIIDLTKQALKETRLTQEMKEEIDNLMIEISVLEKMSPISSVKASPCTDTSNQNTLESFKTITFHE